MGQALLWITLLCALVCAYAGVVEKKDVPAKEVVHAKDAVKAPQQKNHEDDDDDISEDDLAEMFADKLRDALEDEDEDEDLDEEPRQLQVRDEDMTGEELAAVKDAMAMAKPQPRAWIRRVVRGAGRFFRRTASNVGRAIRRIRVPRLRLRIPSRRFYWFRRRSVYRRRYRFRFGDNEAKKVTEDNKEKKDE